MEVSLTHEELALITDALQAREAELAEEAADGESLKELRKLFQRLHTLRTAK